MERRGQNNYLHYDLFIKQVHSISIFNIAFNYLLSPPRIHVSITLLYRSILIVNSILAFYLPKNGGDLS